MSNPVAVPTAMPQQPLEGTGFTNPLVANDTYRTMTGDNLSEDSALTKALADAQNEACRKTNRTLAYGEYTERLFVYKLGYVFPSAIPISHVVSPDAGDVQGAAVWIGFYLPLPEMPVWSGVIPPQSDVTYWGGFTDQTIPRRLAKAISKLAWYFLHPVAMPNVPGGVTTVHVGQMSFSGPAPLSQMPENDPELRRDWSAFYRWPVRAWQ